MGKVVQVELMSMDKPLRHLVTWLEAEHELVRGNYVKLKGMDAWWIVVNVHQEHDRKNIKRGWGMTDFMGPVPKAGS